MITEAFNEFPTAAEVICVIFHRSFLRKTHFLLACGLLACDVSLSSLLCDCLGNI